VECPTRIVTLVPTYSQALAQIMGIRVVDRLGAVLGRQAAVLVHPQAHPELVPALGADLRVVVRVQVARRQNLQDIAREHLDSDYMDWRRLVLGCVCCSCLINSSRLDGTSYCKLQE
jgi:hypothetical protein